MRRTTQKEFPESGAERKCKTPEVREAMFEWFINVRAVLKGRLPKKMFRTKCQQVYSGWLKQQPEPIPEEEQLKFSKHCIQDWMKEYNVSLRKPNKRFAVKNEDRIIRIKDYLQNIWTVRKYFLDTYGVDPPIINGDQMPLHRNESACQKTLSLKSEETFVKENHMPSRERVTCFTQLCSDPKVDLKLEFVFKGKGTRTHLTPPEGVNYQWAPKGSYRIEQILDMINRFNMFNPHLSKKDNVELPVQGPLNNTEAATQPMEPATQSNGDETALDVSIDGSSEDPDIGQYWEISNSKDSIYAQVVEKDPFMVQFFEPNSIDDAYRLNDLKFEVLHKDFVRKVQEPQLIAVGRSRVNNIF